MDFVIEWKQYIDDKSCPDNIEPVINCIYENRHQQLVLETGLKLITDWTYYYDTKFLNNNQKLLALLQSIIDDSYFILGLYMVCIIMTNIITDCKTNLNLTNIENLIPRIKFCNQQTIIEWNHFLSMYSTYTFNKPILNYLCTSIIDDEIHTNFPTIIYNFCRLEPILTGKTLVKYNMYNHLELFIFSEHLFNQVYYIFQSAVKNKISVVFNSTFYSRLYKKNKLYRFLNRMMIFNFEFYKDESIFKTSVERLITFKSKNTNDELTFLTLMYNYFVGYNHTFGFYLSPKLKYIDHESSKLYFNLVRKIYDNNKSIFTQNYIRRVLKHSYGYHFCTNLHEIAYRNCLINKIEMDKVFNPF